MSSEPTQSAEMQTTRRSYDFFKRAKRRLLLTRLLFPRRLRRHEKLLTWAIAQGPLLRVEQAHDPEVLAAIATLGMVGTGETGETGGGGALNPVITPHGLRTDQITALRAQATTMALATASLYPTIPNSTTPSHTIASTTAPRSNPWFEHFLHIDPDQQAQLKAIAQGGALVLTAHTFFHNLLGAFLGQSGAHVIGVAAPIEPTEPPVEWTQLRPLTKPIISAINHGSERLFGGGRYVYTDRPRELAHAIEDAKQRGHCVIALLDHGHRSADTQVNIAGWRFGLQDSLLARWARSNHPVYLALLWPSLQASAADQSAQLAPRFSLSLQLIKSADDQQSATQIAKTYASLLSEWIIQHPWAWQGLRWANAFERDT
ncbi:hypothetical protein GH816_03090 [Betaproteobacteria bacterium LSUCC0115]|nr:hypothetical protein [Burkholderiales bacterium LSUCC0115]